MILDCQYSQEFGVINCKSLEEDNSILGLKLFLPILPILREGAGNRIKKKYYKKAIETVEELHRDLYILELTCFIYPIILTIFHEVEILKIYRSAWVN